MEDITTASLKKFDIDTSILTPGDPTNLYENLTEIGHGNFGAVFSGIEKRTKSIVAIKQISFDGKHSKEKFLEIVKEIHVLRGILHENCVGFKDVYLQRSSVWLVMEHCIGSIYDIMENQNSGFNEENISYIIYYVTMGLAYLHSLNYIHRDIKAANILITESAAIKIADFGSASLKCPANTFVGSPYWMAPEVILAMEDGLYDTKSDIWSLGITSYELGEFKPPHYHLNTMSAMYHIAQSDPPQLSNQKWTDEYKTLTNSMLKKPSDERPSAKELLEFVFLKKNHDPKNIKNILYECLEKSKGDTKSTKKRLNLDNDAPSQELTTDSAETDTESRNSQNQFVDQLVITENISIKSCKRMPSRTIIDNKIKTIRTAATVNRELQDHQDSNYSQLKEYQRLRKVNIKQLQALESKLAAEIEDHKKLYHKSVESIKFNNEKFIKALRDRQKAELDKLTKSEIADEHKFKKLYTSSENKNIFNSFNKECGDKKKHAKQRSGVLNIFDSKSKGDITTTSSSGSVSINTYSEFPELITIRDVYSRKKDDVNFKYFKEESEFLIQAQQLIGNMDLEELQKLEKLETSRLEQLYKLKRSHLEKLHKCEEESQLEYMKKKENDLSKKHILELKNQPKELKIMESKIKKVYMDSIKTQEQQYRFLLSRNIESAPKDQHAEIKANLKSEKAQRIISLQTAMDVHISNVLTSEKNRLSVEQIREKEDLSNKLKREMTSLKNFQTSQFHQLNRSKGKELEKLRLELQKIQNTTSENIKSDYKRLKKELDITLSQFSYQDNIKKTNLLQISQVSCSVDALSVDKSTNSTVSSDTNTSEDSSSLIKT